MNQFVDDVNMDGVTIFTRAPDARLYTSDDCPDYGRLCPSLGALVDLIRQMGFKASSVGRRFGPMTLKCFSATLWRPTGLVLLASCITTSARIRSPRCPLTVIAVRLPVSYCLLIAVWSGKRLRVWIDSRACT